MKRGTALTRGPSWFDKLTMKAMKPDRVRRFATSIHLRARRSDHLGPLLDLAFHEGSKLGWRGGDDIEPGFCRSFLHIRQGHHLHDLGVEPVDDGGGRPGRREQ